MRCIGIDPGLYGACCVLDVDIRNLDKSFVIVDDNYYYPFWNYVKDIEFYDFATLVEKKTFTRRKNRKVEKEYKIIDVMHFEKFLKEKQPNMVFLEGVHSMPTDAHNSAFHFGMVYGQIKTVILLNKIKLQEIPINWKMKLINFIYNYNFLLLDDKEETPYNTKEFNLKLAQRIITDLFKKENTFIEKKKHHNRADSLLIAFVGLIDFFNLSLTSHSLSKF